MLNLVKLNRLFNTWYIIVDLRKFFMDFKPTLKMCQNLLIIVMLFLHLLICLQMESKVIAAQPKNFTITSIKFGFL